MIPTDWIEQQGEETMSIPFRALIFIFALLSGLITSFTVFAQEEAPFDRLDGTGPSQKKVDVIEWEGNLEVHTFPKGSLKGLSVKLDDRTEGKKVMVIGYRFNATGKPLIRRAILGIPFNKNLKAYIDPTNKEFDKIAISNQPLAAPYIAYKLDPAPAQWYPDGDPRNNESDAPKDEQKLGKTQPEQKSKKDESDQRSPASNRGVNAESSEENDGAIKNFSW